jgi:hypothetical protein
LTALLSISRLSNLQDRDAMQIVSTAYPLK